MDDLFSIPLVGSSAGNPNGVQTDFGASLGSADKSELVFDSEGNMVLQTVSTNSATISGEATTTVDSATCGYDFAYRKPKPTKWSAEDTKKFYDALALYGSDQMLINTALPQYQPQQIRQKYKAELRNNPRLFNATLYARKRKVLNTTKFEEDHGQIKNPVYFADINLDIAIPLDEKDLAETTTEGNSPRALLDDQQMEKPSFHLDILDSLFQ